MFDNVERIDSDYSTRESREVAHQAEVAEMHAANEGRGTIAHTPAPWAVERAVEADGSVTFDIFNSDVSACNGVGGGVAYIQTYNSQQAQQQEANARLICAAPALLAALEKIARMDYGNPYASGCADVARRAIELAGQP